MRLSGVFSEHAGTWRHFARRKSGGEGYKRGDLRRGVVNVISSRWPFAETPESQESVVASKALSIARLGMEHLDQSYSSLSKEFSSRGHGNQILDTILRAMGTIREGLKDLEDNLLAGDCSRNVLQRQMCCAVRPDAEVSVGQLIICGDSLLFESSQSSSIGPIKWEEFEKLELFSDQVVAFYVKGGYASYAFSGVSNIQLLESLDVIPVTRSNKPFAEADSPEILESFYPLQDLESWLSDLGGSFMSLPVDSPCQSPQQERLPSDSPKAMREMPPLYEDQADAQSAEVRPIDSLPHTISFYDDAAKLPNAEAPKQASPVFVERLPGVSVDFVRHAFSAQQNWPPQVYLDEEVHAHDFKATNWAKCHRFKDTMVRRLQFQMPVPADVPQAVKVMISLPAETAVTLLARMGMKDDLVVVLQEVVSHDVAYGNNFVVQEFLNFNSHPEGGVLFEKFVEIRWVTALPWYAGVVGTFIEMKAKSDGKASGRFMADYLKDRALSSHSY